MDRLLPRLFTSLFLVATTAAAFLAGSARAGVAGFTPVYRFGSNPDGFFPSAQLAEGADGVFYGVTPRGGPNAAGAVFEVTASGAFSVVHAFSGLDANNDNADGAAPAAVIVARDGNLYGLASGGGANAGGVVFRLTPDGAFTVLHQFAGGAADGTDPRALVQTDDGNLTGVTFSGGAANQGTIFTVTPAGQFTLRHSFTGGADGANPTNLIHGLNGDVFGYVNPLSGVPAANPTLGEVFRFSADGVFTTLFTVPMSMTIALAQGADGALVVAINGNNSMLRSGFYRVDLAGNATLLLADFLATGRPTGPLIQSQDGNFYGISDGVNNLQPGSIYRLTPAGVGSYLYNVNGSDRRSLIEGRDSNFYGVSPTEGSNGAGEAFSVTHAGAGTDLHDFAAINGEGPTGDLVYASDGKFYIATSGDEDGILKILQIDPSGSVNILRRLSPTNEGSQIVFLMQGKDRALYGVSSNGGANGHGTFFKAPLDGSTPTVLYSFTAKDGLVSAATVLEAQSGDFYLTLPLGAKGNGRILKVSPAGVAKVAHGFTDAKDGARPLNLIEYRPGFFYGVTGAGGMAAGRGVIFTLDANGEYGVLHRFSMGDGNPMGGLILGQDGNFYGATNFTAFVVTPAGDVSMLASTIGYGFPDAPLLQAADGSFYGAYQSTPFNGAPIDVVRLSPSGAVNLVHSATASEGGNSLGTFDLGAENPSEFYGVPLTGGPGGDIYGIVRGADGSGLLFKILLAEVNAGPSITSAPAATFQENAPFRFQLTADQPGLEFTSDPLPAGLTLDPATGVISGTMSASLGVEVLVTARGDHGVAQSYLSLNPGPTVNVQATVPVTTVGSGAVGVFTLTSSGVGSTGIHTDPAFRVNYALGGDAVNRKDYRVLTGTVDFKAGKGVKRIEVKAKGDLGGAAKRKVELTLLPGEGYFVGPAASAKVKLRPAQP